MKKFSLILLIATLIISFNLVACTKSPTPEPTPTPSTPATPSPESKPVTLKLWSAFNTDQWAATPCLFMFIDKVNELGKDVNLSIELLGGPELFSGYEGVEAQAKGLLDMSWTSLAYTSSLVPETRVATMLGRSPSEERESGAYDLMNQFLSKANSYYIFRVPMDPYFTVYLNKKVTTPDFTGLRIRTGGGGDDYFIQALGGTAIVMSISEIYTALEHGAIDGYDFPCVGIVQRGYNELTKYIVSPDYGSCPTVVTINLEKWNSLDDAQRTVLTQAGIEMESDLIPVWQDYYKADRQKALDSGIELIEFSAEDEAKFLHATEAGWERVIEETPSLADYYPLVKMQ